jgi:hypothetical protein
MRKLPAAITLWFGTLAVAACARERSAIGLGLSVPHGLLDTATVVELRVSQGGSCDEATGRVSGEGDPQIFELDRCGAGWCKTISLDKDDAVSVFHVLAKNGGQEIAEGCAEAAINQDPLTVDIKVKRSNPPPCCNDGVTQSVEQCDTGLKSATDCTGATPPAGNTCVSIQSDDVCECDCLAKEIDLSVPGTMPDTTNDPGSKSELALAFSGSAGGEDVAKSLRAVYTDNFGLGGAPDINLRLLKGSLYPTTQSPPLLKQLRLPLLCSNVLGTGLQRIQRAAAIARVSSEITGVVFADNRTNPSIFNISLSALGSNGCAPSSPVQVNVNTATTSDSPDIAGGPEGQALVVWNQLGQLRGRIWNAGTNELSPATDIDLGAIAPTGKPHVAGGDNGWMVVYPGSGAGDGDGVFFKTVAPTGQVGSETKVNIVTAGVQDQPDVAMQKDGRAVVVWQSGGQVLFQRYVLPTMAVSGDQDSPLSQSAPAPASMPVVAGDLTWFAAAWVSGDGRIWARFIGQDSGFGLNHVNGQNDDFDASHPYFKTPRTGPAVAIGGEGFVAIGWQDTSAADDHHGIIVRRFPLPE